MGRWVAGACKREDGNRSIYNANVYRVGSRRVAGKVRGRETEEEEEERVGEGEREGAVEGRVRYEVRIASRVAVLSVTFRSVVREVGGPAPVRSASPSRVMHAEPSEGAPLLAPSIAATQLAQSPPPRGRVLFVLLRLVRVT